MSARSTHSPSGRVPEGRLELRARRGPALIVGTAGTVLLAVNLAFTAFLGWSVPLLRARSMLLWLTVAISGFLVAVTRRPVVILTPRGLVDWRTWSPAYRTRWSEMARVYLYRRWFHRVLVFERIEPGEDWSQGPLLLGPLLYRRLSGSCQVIVTGLTTPFDEITAYIERHAGLRVEEDGHAEEEPEDSAGFGARLAPYRRPRRPRFLPTLFTRRGAVVR